MPSAPLHPRLTLGPALLLAASLCAPAPALARNVALVIGIGEYPKLPPEFALPHAAQDASALAEVLRKRAGFEVMELKDGFATRQAIEAFLVQSLPTMVGAQDTLLIYIESHGMGADFDDPRVLPSDASAESLEATSMSVSELGRRVREAVNVRALVLITDTAHPGEIGGLALLGPHAKSWPDLPENTVILSASSPREPSIEGLFAPILVHAFEGAADASGDGTLSASELHRFVVEQVPERSGDQVHPAEAGDYAPGLPLWTVLPAPSAPAPVATVVPEPAPVPAAAAEPPAAPRVRHRRWAVATPALGASALLAGGAVVAYRRGQDLSPVVFHEQDLPVGGDYDTTYSAYSRWYRANLVLGISAGVLAATGGFFALVPVGDGVAAGLHARF